MINGVHAIVYTDDADADRAFFRDVLGFTGVDAGHGWLIFALPPAELACHPASGPTEQELFLMCDDIDASVETLRAKGIAVSDVSDQGWGRLATVTTPGGAHLGVYQPRHPTAIGT
jgi:catechol 2,3-dioxygenase-like lactoylglutathione lyase family enzyme